MTPQKCTLSMMNGRQSIQRNQIPTSNHQRHQKQNRYQSQDDINYHPRLFGVVEIRIQQIGVI
ncbi:hypothetical protein ACHAXS_011934, partial [Conticribra weissflogii]